MVEKAGTAQTQRKSENESFAWRVLRKWMFISCKKLKKSVQKYEKTIKSLKNELRRSKGKMTLSPARDAHIHEKWAFGVGESTIFFSTVQEVHFTPAPFLCFLVQKWTPPKAILGSEKAWFLNIVLNTFLRRRGHRFWWLLGHIWDAFFMICWS